MNIPKTVGCGGCGKIRVYYSTKYKRKVIEKTVGPNFIRAKRATQLRITKIIKDYCENEDMLFKESIFMLMMKVGKLDCCVEIFEFAPNPFRIIMEYCEGGDLRKILDTVEVPMIDRMHMIGQILSALSKIHQFGIIHGDLKCQNIFLAKQYFPGQGENIKIKIGDFGLSEIGGDLVYGGTPGFAAPEVFKTGGSFASDIYSVGKVMLEIMTGLPVEFIATINVRNLNIIKNKLPKFLNINQFYSIVIPCLSENPKNRPTAARLIETYSSLVIIWVFCETMNINMLSKYKLGENVPVDCHKHPLILSDAQMRGYIGEAWYCSICNNSEAPFLNNALSFCCSGCDYDLCDKCIELHNYKYVNKKMLERVNNNKKTKVYVKRNLHIHCLLLSGEERNYPKEGSWHCDICKVSACLDVYSFHCKACEYDVCYSCYIKNFEIRKEDSCCIIF